MTSQRTVLSRSAAWVRFGSAEAPPLGAIFGGIGVIAAASAAVLPLDLLPFSVCFFKAFTGLPCPTCGGTRVLACLAHLDVASAFAMNPLVAAGAFMIAAWALADLALLPRRRAAVVELRPGLASVVRGTAVALLAANWIYLLAAGR
jgi:hypothetical protein